MALDGNQNATLVQVHRSVDGNTVVDPKQVFGLHAHATVTGGRTSLRIERGSVNANPTCLAVQGYEATLKRVARLSELVQLSPHLRIVVQILRHSPVGRA